jgi:hypothetical protein
MFFVFSNVTEKVEKYYTPGNGQLSSVHWDIGSAMNALNPKIETVINKPKEKVIEATKPKLTEEQIKISKMKPEDRHAYTCKEKFGFRKGSDKFKDCVFEMYKVETELEKLELQKELLKSQIELAKANAYRQDRLAQAQTEAAKMQSLAAQQQANSARTAETLALLNMSLKLLTPPAAPPINKTTCSFNGRFMNCF